MRHGVPGGVAGPAPRQCRPLYFLLIVHLSSGNALGIPDSCRCKFSAQVLKFTHTQGWGLVPRWAAQQPQDLSWAAEMVRAASRPIAAQGRSHGPCIFLQIVHLFSGNALATSRFRRMQIFCTILKLTHTQSGSGLVPRWAAQQPQDLSCAAENGRGRFAPHRGTRPLPRAVHFY